MYEEQAKLYNRQIFFLKRLEINILGSRWHQVSTLGGYFCYIDLI